MKEAIQFQYKIIFIDNQKKLYSNVGNQFTSLLKMMRDFNKICRTCLEEITDSKPLFNVRYINEEKLTLSEILTVCTSIEVSEDDSLPKQMCIECENNILNAFRFHQQCRNSDLVLRGLVSRSVKSQLLEVKSLMNFEESNSIQNYNTSKQNNVHHLVDKVGDFGSYMNTCLKDHLASGKILYLDNNYSVNTTSSLGRNNVNLSEQGNSSQSFIEINQENYLAPSYQGIEAETIHKELQNCIRDVTLQPLSSLKSKKYSSSSSHSSSTDSVDSQHVDLNSSSISSEDTFNQDQVDDLDEDVTTQLTFVKILNEDSDDEGDFSNQEHTSYVFNGESQENDVSPGYQAVEKSTHKELHTYGDKTLSSSDNENDLSSYHTESVDSPDVDLILSDISSKSNSDEAVETQLTSIEILQEDIYDEEENFRDQDGRCYVCDICHKGFSSNGSLKAHMKVHTDVRDHICSICNKGFKDKGTLMTHRRIHTSDARNYICGICNKGFKAKGTLKTHRRIHTGARNYICGICNKGFKEKGTLKTHMTIHTGETPFTCNVCNKSFSRAASFWKHMKSHKLAADKK